MRQFVSRALFERIRVGRRFEPTHRPLGLLQRWYAAQPTQRIVVAILELDAPPSEAALEAAVRALCARYPSALGVCEERSMERLRVRPLRAAEPLPMHVEPGADACQLATELVHLAFSPGAPLFRLARAAGDRELVCAFDHLVCDGVSVGIFATELARALAGLPLGAASPDDAAPLDARLDLRPSLAQLTRAALDRSTPLPLPLPPVSEPLRTSLRRWQLPSAQLEQLLARARERGVTLYAVLAAASLIAAVETLNATRGRLRVHTPISLRARCNPEPTGLGVFIASSDSDIDPTEFRGTGSAAKPALWPLAQRVLSDLAGARPSAPGKLGLLAFAGDLSALARRYDARSNGRTATVEVSNVGRLQGVPSGARVWLTQGAHYHSALFVLTVATSSSDGALRCCLSFPMPLVSAEKAEQFMQALSAQLEGALGE